MENSRTTDDWLNFSISELKKRNKVQANPYLDIYTAYTRLWKDQQNLTRQHLILQNQVANLQHEIQEELNRDDIAPSIDRLRITLTTIQEDIKNRNKSAIDNVRGRAELEQQLEDQNKYIFDLQDELRTLKTELETSRESIRTLEMHAANLSNSMVALRLELQSVRSIVAESEAKTRRLEVENAELVNRIVIDKEKNANELNEMNKIVSRKTSKSTFSFLKAITGLSTDNQTILEKEGAETRPHASSTATLNQDDQESYVTDGYGDLPSHKSTVLLAGDGVRAPTTPSRTMRCHTTEINDICCDPHHFVTAGADSMVKIYDFGTQQKLNNLTTGGPVYAVDVGGNLVAGACSDKICRVWNITSGKLLHNLAGHSNKVMATKFLRK